MSFVGDLFGLNGGGDRGGAGMAFQATAPNNAQMNDVWTNTQHGLGQQQDFINALAAQGGIANQSQIFDQQQGLAGLLMQNAMGGGPNPAQAQFQQNANQIGAQTAGLIGSQKGMSPALQARLMAQQGAGAGQAAAGQAATLQAQQQLAAQQALMQQQANMANLSTQQVGQQQNALNSYQSGALQQQGNLYGLQTGATGANAGVAKQVGGAQGNMFGGILNGVGMAFMADGGQVAMPAAPYADAGPSAGPKSMVGKQLNNQPAQSDSSDPMFKGSSNFAQGITTAIKGAPVAAAHGGAIRGEAYARNMKPVPGKAKTAGDSKKNDTQPAMLSPGEIIIPRSIATHPNAPEMAARFVAAVKAKSGRGIG